MGQFGSAVNGPTFDAAIAATTLYSDEPNGISAARKLEHPTCKSNISPVSSQTSAALPANPAQSSADPGPPAARHTRSDSSATRAGARSCNLPDTTSAAPLPAPSPTPARRIHSDPSR